MTHEHAPRLPQSWLLSGLWENEFAENKEVFCPQIPEISRNKICSLTVHWPYHSAVGRTLGDQPFVGCLVMS